MAFLLRGEPVAENVRRRIGKKCEILQKRGVVPTLGIVRAGSRGNDIAYERGAMKQAQKLGIKVKQITLAEEISGEELCRVLQEINTDSNIHGCLIFRPLPKRFNEAKILEILKPEKDVDVITAASMGRMVTGAYNEYAPCTAAACLELLKYYQIPLKGRRVTVVGKGINVGLSISLLLLNEEATVSVCHIFTAPEEVKRLCNEADVLVSAAGCAGLIGAEHVRPGQIVIDVGVNMGNDGKTCGDADFNAVEPIVEAITPVPGGVGAVTSCILMEHVVDAALRETEDPSEDA
ncbi:bifunctional 5,10-methylenetetrahydrofolate dehydrogenase/5,10-methenyltetrahydrofolate cyclohydrolase [[Clostridium] symbiosum]|uniref:bifunctional 5,10-methylenetetrahydrofolate dehydrogenase/5,10-methenyltetrahydrofolate cyclohydrolase n=1 Tax=Clostridium symbiosum TaxID=1512 RepID=UPI001D060C8B|nr:bifunctional 5,10-methylenetetrahydrofolate dehydrogenase/5,10-methenyltetrahydrofolate cyclohydrolase [[Clostridium] symbiosum]MCB6607909.1 bifunctional 5,10-methylenetetrahydrofolate dehydrogenase/5,10-methenyltetrahydrofolate cyclohydrolase [[Clostridium] symbiosum]MCB6930410.1 bifunctional 5,10-methylenetetrahydrofolate dehydrogenase/5,10-methenyltetrahydrofolate cyclohydrolase [[Clostridium] symbiosum]